MASVRSLTPYMSAYAGEFSDSGHVNWQPYTMYFHPYGYASDVVSTDASGFRYSQTQGRPFSVADHVPGPVDVIAGSSTVFGIGASADRHTLASRMSLHAADGVPWLNFGGRSYNSTQEMILFALNRARAPQARRVVLLSGFNDLGLARLPARARREHGAFFMCNAYFEAMDKQGQSRFSEWFGRSRRDDRPDAPPSVDEQMAYASELTLRNLANWRAMCADMGADLTFVLQPLANWVRTTGSAEEESLFAELEARGRFAESYGDILTAEAHAAYAEMLRAGTAALGVRFIDLTPHLQARVPPDFWLFVDRIHFTDQGHDLVSRLLLELIDRKEDR